MDRSYGGVWFHGLSGLLVGALLAVTAQAAPFTSVQDGDWDTPATWGGGVPGAGDTVTVAHTVGLSATATVSSATVTGSLVFDGWNTVLNAGTMNVNSGGIVTHNINTDTNGGDGWTPDNRINLQVNDLNVFGGALITADGKGYQGQCGPGAGGSDGGGGHGGVGGDYVYSGAGGGPTYGSGELPTAPGSGGGPGTGLPGGGAVWIEAANSVLVDGEISADGKGMSSYMYNAGGSGGSIMIHTQSITGTGALTATGGGQASPVAWTYNRGGGGGGRISLRWPEYLNSLSPAVDLSGGTVLGSSTVSGNPGTLMPEPHAFTLLIAGVALVLARRKR